jgi:glycosyltransferase involved in cell wall biosynthesis
MIIGIAGPMTLNLLDFNIESQRNIPIGYDFPMASMLINAILKRGHKVVAYTTSIGIDKPLIYKGKNLVVCIGRRRKCHSARDLFKLERGDLVDLMRNYPADIINSQWSYEFSWAAIESGIKTIVTLRDNAMTIFRYKTDPYRFMRLIMNYIVLKKVKYLSVNSKYLFDKLDTQKQKKTRIIPNFYSKVIESINYNQEEKSKYILSVSNGFGKRKNINTALKAFAFVRSLYPDIEYHLVGDDMEPFGAAYQFAKKNNILSGIKFLGRLPFIEVIKKIQNAKIFLHPSREESFGMAVLEAMIIGTPVIGGENSGNVPYLLDHGKAGELCNINSPEDVGKSILKLLNDRQYSEKLIKNAYKCAEKNYSENSIITKYLDYYYNVFGHRFN